VKREDIGRREELLAWVDSAFGDFTSGKPHQVIEQIKEIFWQVDQRATAAEAARAAEGVAHLENEIERYRRSSFLMSQTLHNVMVGNQAAWIEWQHGGGAEAAMTWIHNGLAGPGLIPDGGEAQAFFNANVDDRLDPPATPDDLVVTRMHVIAAGRRAVEMADAAGLVLTISQIPRLPLAMGNYSTRVEVREKVVRDAPIAAVAEQTGQEQGQPK